MKRYDKFALEALPALPRIITEGPFPHWYYDREIGREIKVELYRAWPEGQLSEAEEAQKLEEAVGLVFMKLCTLQDLQPEG